MFATALIYLCCRFMPFLLIFLLGVQLHSFNGLCRDNVVIVSCLLKIDRFQCVLHVDDVVISFIKVSDKYKRSRSAVINGKFIIM